MIKKIILLLFFSLIIFGCSAFEFVYDNNLNKLDKLNGKTIVSIGGDDSEMINSHLLDKIGVIENIQVYLLIVKSKKNLVATVVDKDATASKFSIEHEISYDLQNIKENCTIIYETIQTKSFYNSKSAGYSFGSDLSKKEVTENNLKSNIDKFFNSLAIKNLKLSCI